MYVDVPDPVNVPWKCDKSAPTDVHELAEIGALAISSVISLGSEFVRAFNI